METPAFEVLRLVPMTGIVHWDSRPAGLTDAARLIDKGAGRAQRLVRVFAAGVSDSGLEE